MSKLKTLSPGRALYRFGFRQSLKGALIMGIIAGIVAGGQGAAYSTTYPTTQSRAEFKTTLEKAPALGIIYGETRDLPTPAGYMAYRTAAVLTLIASVWGLMTAIKLFRGQEEDGRWELIASSGATASGASYRIFLGFCMSILVAFALTAISITAIGATLALDAPATTGLFISLAIFAPVLFFSGLGFFVSQLSTTKRRALLYGLIPLLALFALRAIGNTTGNLRLLKSFTPFGWTDLMSPIIDPQLVWLLPSLLFTLLFVGIALYLAHKRDLGAGIIHESSTTKPRYFLLGSTTALALRQNTVLFVSWGIGVLVLTTLMTELSGIAAQAITDSPSLKNALSQLSGTHNNFTVTFIAAGLVFTAVALLIMVTASMAAIRGSEAKNQLDNILVQPVRRSQWLIGRLCIILVAAVIIAVICAYTTWLLAAAQHVSLDLGNLLLVNVALTGTVIFTLGLGTLLYGIAPRIAVIGMYALVGWSFLIDMVESVVKLNDTVAQSSLLHYISPSPINPPDWKTFAWLTLLGLAMAVIGVITFTKRGIITE